MTIETQLVAIIKPLVGNRFYADAPPAGPIEKPYGTYARVGGPSYAFVEGGAAPDKRRPRFQINLWHTSRPAVDELAQEVEDALRAATVFQAESQGEPEARHEPVQKLFGTEQDYLVFGDR